MTTTAFAPAACAACGAQLSPALLACPGCDRLVHGQRLKTLAAEAEAAEGAGDLSRALAAWRTVMELLPPASTQFDRVLEKVQSLSDRLPAGAHEQAQKQAAAAVAGPKSKRSRTLAGLGAFGVLLAKFKWVLLALLGKGKMLVVGLGQLKTFLSMALALGVYAAFYGWKFALGLIVSIYVHEMGHVFWLRRYGLAATAPMFIPGFGALVRLKQHPATVGEDARVGLAGPVWGAAAAVAALGIGALASSPLFFTIGSVGAWINLFNLAPVWQLDGGRGFAALSRQQRGLTAGVLGVLALAGADGILWLLAIAATYRALSKNAAPLKGDRSVFATYVALAVGLTGLMVLGRHAAGPMVAP